MSVLHTVRDGRSGHVQFRSWEVAPLEYSGLLDDDIGRTVIYRAHGRAEAGTISSWRGGWVWARFSSGDTAACCNPGDLVFGSKELP